VRLEHRPMTLEPKPSQHFVETAFIRDVVNRALSYLRCGFPVNLSGPSGMGKTTLALHIAARLFRPVVLIYGNEHFGNTDTMGGLSGYKYRRVVDNFIHSVVKTEEDFSRHWVDGRLVTACKMGYTLVYDEFTRSHPEANNALLSVLEEGVLAFPHEEPSYVKVDPHFSAIFTSNPEEYAGVYKSQDALRDRMITIYLDQYDEETESAIASAKSGLLGKEARKIVQLVRRIRGDVGIPVRPTIRASIAIAKILFAHNLETDFKDPYIRAVVIDVISSHINGSEERNSIVESLKETLSLSAIRGIS
jgi:nitric oxide reductase NorQ protein